MLDVSVGCEGAGRTWVDARAGGDEDDVAVGGGRDELLDNEGALQLDRRVVGGLEKIRRKKRTRTNVNGYRTTIKLCQSSKFDKGRKSTVIPTTKLYQPSKIGTSGCTPNIKLCRQ